jgi:hypothetical protein
VWYYRRQQAAPLLSPLPERAARPITVGPSGTPHTSGLYTKAVTLEIRRISSAFFLLFRWHHYLSYTVIPNRHPATVTQKQQVCHLLHKTLPALRYSWTRFRKIRVRSSFTQVGIECSYGRVCVYIYMCVRVCVCVCVRARARVYNKVQLKSTIQHTENFSVAALPPCRFVIVQQYSSVTFVSLRYHSSKEK